MKKSILTVLAATLLATGAQACIGGTWLQITTSNNRTVIATYDITTGRMIALNRSYTITGISEILENDHSRDICADGLCRQIDDIEQAPILVSYSRYDSRQRRTVKGAKVIANVTIGANAPVAKGMISAGADFNPLTIQSCSKK